MGNASSLPEPTAEELDELSMQVDEIFNPDVALDKNQIRSEYLKRLNELQRQELLQMQRAKANVDYEDLKKLSIKNKAANDMPQIIKDRFAQLPNMSPETKVKRKERKKSRYIFEGEQEDHKMHSKERDEGKDAVQAEIDKKEQFLAQLTPFDASEYKNEISQKNQQEFFNLKKIGSQQKSNRLKVESLKQDYANHNGSKLMNEENDGDSRPSGNDQINRSNSKPITSKIKDQSSKIYTFDEQIKKMEKDKKDDGAVEESPVAAAKCPYAHKKQS